MPRKKRIVGKWRQTGIGLLIKRDMLRAQEELLDSARRLHGNGRLMAAEFGVSTRHLYRLITRANLVEQVNEYRAQRHVPPDWVERTKKALQ